jgi:lipid A disaccharide synthetase
MAGTAFQNRADAGSLHCVLPFEPAISKAPLKAVYIGHPLVNRADETAPRRRCAPWRGRRRIALQPGSRAAKSRTLPRLLEAASDETAERRLFVHRPRLSENAGAWVKVAASAPARPRNLFFVDGEAGRRCFRRTRRGARHRYAETCLMRCPTVLVTA